MELGMPIFSRKSKTQGFEPELAALRQRAEALDTKRRTADAELTEATMARQRHHIEGDLDDAKTGQALQDKVNVSASMVVGLEDAIAVVQTQIAEIEQRIAAERDAAERSAAADALTRDLDEFEKALPDYLAGARRITDAAQAFGHHHFEAGQLSALAQNTRAQIETAGLFILEELRSMVVAIRDARAPIPPKKPTTASADAPTKVSNSAVTVQDPFTYTPVRHAPTFRGAVPPSPKLDPALAAAGFRMLDRSSQAREISYNEPRIT
jgi:hypothetical protein